MRKIEEVRELFAKDRFATENGAVVDEIGEKYSKCSLRLSLRHKNAMGDVMGGVYFTLADFAFAVASNWEKPSTVSISSDIRFLGTAKGETLCAVAKCLKDGRSTCCYRVDVTDGEGKIVAAVTITGYKLK
ncbi:MAG: PaaI family thioesterase [Clostridia bacterium]|nr:PaaI family thioesterase [Clostridia bacterium]